MKLCKKPSARLRISGYEAVLIIILVVAFWFFSASWCLRTEYSSKSNVFFTYWGFPLEAIKVGNDVEVFDTRAGVDVNEGPPDFPDDFGTMVDIERTYGLLWGGVVVNIITYIVISIIIVKLLTRAYDEINYRKYYRL